MFYIFFSLEVECAGIDLVPRIEKPACHAQAGFSMS
jgi:predicted hydrocarbon binding protein